MAKNPHKIKITIDNEELEQVDSFRYLGQTTNPTGNSETEVVKRIGIAKSRFGELKNILTTQQIQPATKIRVLKCYVHSALLYGSETWTLSKKLERRIEAFEMWTYRRMGKISWKEKKSNIEVCRMLEVKQSLLKEIKTRKLKFFGHVKRHESLCKQTLEGKINGKRPRGRVFSQNSFKVR